MPAKDHAEPANDAGQAGDPGKPAHDGFAARLGDGVERDGRKRMVLLDQGAIGNTRSENRNRTGKDEALDPAGPRGLQAMGEAHKIDGNDLGGRFAFTIDACGDGGGMNDRGDPVLRHGLAKKGGVTHVALDLHELSGCEEGADRGRDRAPVETHGALATGSQPFNNIEADKAGPSCDEDGHARLPPRWAS